MGDYGGYEDGNAYGGYDGGDGNYNYENQNNTNTGGGFVGGTGGTPARGGKKKLDTVNPVTIKRLASMPITGADTFELDGKELGKISLVGLVKSKEAKNVQITYVLDDGTGEIEVAQWINEGDDSTLAQEARDGIQPNMYVRVFGQLRTFNNKLSISAFSIRKVEDSNEITHHFLNTIFTHLQLTKGPINPALKQSTPAFATPGAGAGGVSGTAVSMNEEGAEDFSALQMSVLNAFRSVQSEEGMSLTQVIETLAQENIQPDDVKRIVAELQEDGHLYSTVDDQHFKTTDEM